MTRTTQLKPGTWTLDRAGSENYGSNDNNIKRDDNSEEK
jgi:hypothetical protein